MFQQQIDFICLKHPQTFYASVSFAFLDEDKLNSEAEAKQLKGWCDENIFDAADKLNKQGDKDDTKPQIQYKQHKWEWPEQ